MVAEPLPVKPQSLAASQSALQLLIFRLAAQERAATRMRSRAERYMALSLAFLGFYVGILVALNSDIATWTWVGAFVIAGMFLLGGLLFIAIHWPASLATAPEPEDINLKTWEEGEAAIWTWSYALQQAFEENRERVRRNSRLNTWLLVIVVLQALTFLGFAFATVWV